MASTEAIAPPPQDRRQLPPCQSMGIPALYDQSEFPRGWVLFKTWTMNSPPDVQPLEGAPSRRESPAGGLLQEAR